MRQWRVGTFSMGLILICAGIILLLQKINGHTSIEFLLKWWPIILILLGLEILFSVYFGKQESPKIKYDGVSIFIIITILILCFVSYGISSFPIRGRINGVTINGNIFSPSYENTYNKSFSINPSGNTKLHIKNSYGDIKIEKSTTKNIKITAKISSRNKDKNYAKKISDKVVQITKGKEIFIASKAEDYSDNIGNQNVSVDFSVEIPSDMYAKVEDAYGDIAVSGIDKDLSITNNNGDVIAATIGGTLSIENEYGSVKVADVKGACFVKNNNDDITIKNIGKSLKVENEYGDISVQGINGNTQLSDNNAQITAQNIAGSVNISNQYGDIGAKKISGDVTIDNNNGDVALADIGGSVKASNEYANIKVINPNKLVVLSCKNGDIELQSDKALTNNVTIDNQYNDITLKLPPSQTGYFKAYATLGNINSKLKLNVKSEDNDNDASINEKLGSGTPTFDLKNSNGDISIE